MNFNSQTQLLKIFFRTSVGPRTEKSEMGWLCCENRFPTDSSVFLSSVDYLKHPHSYVEQSVFGRVGIQSMEDSKCRVVWCPDCDLSGVGGSY